MTVSILSCGTSKKISETTPAQKEVESWTLDTLEIEPANTELFNDEVKIYRASQVRYHDLIHTALDLKFDWEKEKVIGTAIVTISPLMYPQSNAILDAKNFEFKKVALGKSGQKNLKYTYDGKCINIKLDRTYKRGEKIDLYLDYVATPRADGGSAAITSDKGLFFINPRLEEKNKPQQIWTQGETEHNSNWMPTFDQPNERATQEIKLTVQDKFITLSNGLLINSTKNANGTRTDHWKMDKPHAPYLNMIAVGEFSKVKDQWKDIPLAYYVEKEYEKDAKAIFANTPEMLEFFSGILDYKYPWQKYDQIVVRDYVSGAMENTTAVIFGQQVQKHANELEETNNDYIVAHELFHHWFGDLVTTESWSNLTLNEGFANYSEYLWFEHHYGKDYAEQHRESELEGYLASGFYGNFHPLVWFEYEKPEDMFDAHSYNKGGLALHMLRHLIGDEAFFGALNLYLKKHEYTAVEVDELRMAFEDVTGLDLNWFFDQYYIGTGHPILNVKYAHKDGITEVSIEQVQDPKAFRPVFKLPIEFAIYDENGKETIVKDTITKRNQTFALPNSKKELIIFDPSAVILGQITEVRTFEENVQILKKSKNYIKKSNAFNSINNDTEKLTEAQKNEVINTALVSESNPIVIKAINLATETQIALDKTKLKNILSKKNKASLKKSALDNLSLQATEEDTTFLISLLEKENSPIIKSSLLTTIARLKPTKGIELAKQMESSNSLPLINSIAEIFTTNQVEGTNKYLNNKLDIIDGEHSPKFAMLYLQNAFSNSPEKALDAVKKMGTIAKNQQGSSPWKRFGFASALAGLKKQLSDKAAPENYKLLLLAPTNKLIEEIKAGETNGQLKSIFADF